MSWNKQLLNNSFSHIYIEKEAMKYTVTKEILKKLKNSKPIEINSYKEVFSKNNQNFKLQKQTPKIILAVKKENFIYPGAKVCESFGNENFYYASSVFNCIFDCEYCYLQGVYSSANIVIFVNIDEMFKEIEEILKTKSMYICISYDTDLLALENITGFVKKWYDFTLEHKNLKIELRTKTANISPFLNLLPNENFILAWTLSPLEFSKNHELKTPNLIQRIFAMRKALELGWTVRLCFDPIINIKNFEKEYKDMIEYTFSNIDSEKILDISIGTFRISKDYMKRMRKNRKNSLILNFPFVCKDNVYSYDTNRADYMISFVKNEILKFAKESKIFI